MNVETLIAKLQQIEDKTLPVVCIGDGWECEAGDVESVTLMDKKDDFLYGHTRCVVLE